MLTQDERKRLHDAGLTEAEFECLWRHRQRQRLVNLVFLAAGMAGLAALVGLYYFSLP